MEKCATFMFGNGFVYDEFVLRNADMFESNAIDYNSKERFNTCDYHLREWLTQ
jgi:hypothetical protein